MFKKKQQQSCKIKNNGSQRKQPRPLIRKTESYKIAEDDEAVKHKRVPPPPQGPGWRRKSRDMLHLTSSCETILTTPNYSHRVSSHTELVQCDKYGHTTRPFETFHAKEDWRLLSGFERKNGWRLDRPRAVCGARCRRTVDWR